MLEIPPLDMPLARLEGADLIRRLHELERTYQFKRNLIQESAYASLLRNDRRTAWNVFGTTPRVRGAGCLI